MKIVLATNNRHKVEEISNILDSSKYDLLLQNEAIGGMFEVEENGKSLEENAYLKAIQIYTICQTPTIADDTGLEISSLAGAPGVHSARYAGEHGNDKANREKVLDELKDNSNRAAQFRTVLCFHDGVRTLFGEGICKGQILKKEIGEGGFGYDSIFVAEGQNLSFAEMSPSAKNAISHRRLAINSLLEIFERYDT